MRMNSWSINFAGDTGVYYLTFAWVAVSTLCLWAFTRTPMGRLALAIRDNEQRVRFLGFNTHRAKTLIFATSTMFTGVAGALLAIANEATNYMISQAQALANGC
jgi:branched-chain amino acid transport system permease protein